MKKAVVALIFLLCISALFTIISDSKAKNPIVDTVKTTYGFGPAGSAIWLGIIIMILIAIIIYSILSKRKQT